METKNRKTISRTALTIITAVYLVGVMTIAITIHEAYHVYANKTPISLCYDFGTPTIAAHVNTVMNPLDEPTGKQELKAYTLMTITAMILIIGSAWMLANAMVKR